MKREYIPPLADLRVAKRRVCWRQDLTVPHESLWSRLRKFGTLNGTYGRELMALFNDPQKPRARSYDRGVPITDLRAAATLNHDELSALASGASPRTLGVISDYVPATAESRYCLDVWAAPGLKFCPDCLANGIHVTYFQLHFVHGCPVHKRALETECPRCAAKIPYEPPACAKDLGFRCKCGHVFWRWEDNPKPRPISRSVCQRLEAAGEWIRRLTPAIARLHYPATELISDPSSAKDSMLGITQLATFFALTFPQFGKLPGSFRSAARKKYRVTQYLPPQMVVRRRGKAMERELTAIYKSICRHLYRRHLRLHRRAMQVIIQDSGDTLTLPDIEFHWRPPFAPAAHAFLLWRAFWEGIPSAEKLFRKHEPKQRYPYYTTDYTWREVLIQRYREMFGSVCDGLPSRARPGVEAHWFASCCYTSFLSFVADVISAFKQYPKASYGLFRRLTTAGFESFMTPIMLPLVVEGGLVELHWFDTSPRAKLICEKVIDHVPTRREVQEYREAIDLAHRTLLE